MTRPAICTAKGKRWTIVRATLSMLALHLLSHVAAGAIADESGVSVEWAREAFEVRSAPAETPFTQHEGYQFGLTRSNTFNARDFFPPFFKEQLFEDREDILTIHCFLAVRAGADDSNRRL